MKPVTQSAPRSWRGWTHALGARGQRSLRLVTGLTLFTYVSTHLLNHALGNISIPAMEAGLVLQKFLWQGLLGTAALYGALATHLLLGVWAFYARRHYGWTVAEVVQVVLGLSIPPLLCNHVFVTRVALAAFGTEKGYAQELVAFWVNAPALGVQQVAVLLIAWVHGCLGVAFWLRLKSWFAGAAPLLLSAAVVLPLLALLGFYQGGRQVLALAADPAWRAANLQPSQIGRLEDNLALARWRNRSNAGFAGLVLLVVAARGVRGWRERRGGSVRVFFPNGHEALVPRGFSVLEASRVAGVAHAGVCGGRARCTTCRVRVSAGAQSAPPPLPGEAALLARLGGGGSVRLACQLRPTGDIAVVPLVAPRGAQDPLLEPLTAFPGEERFIVAVVVDMRDSVRLAETRLPFDAVFVIDRFIAAVADAVAEAGGRADQFTGDGLVATFGLTCPPAEACRQALAALGGIGRNVAALNVVLAGEAEPIRFGVGVHGSMAVVGEIGFAETRVFTALGDAVNAASRLQELCKEFGCEAVISEDVCRLSGRFLALLARQEVRLRGRAAPLAVRTVARVGELRAVRE